MTPSSKRALIGPSGCGKSWAMKGKAMRAHEAGERIVVLDHGRTWMNVGQVDSCVYTAATDVIRSWGIRDADLMTAPLPAFVILELEHAPSTPGPAFHRLCQQLREAPQPTLLILDETYMLQAHRSYVGPVIESCEADRVLVAGQCLTDIDWLGDGLLPGLVHEACVARSPRANSASLARA